MRRREALDILAAHREELRDLFIKSLSLFGSVARDEATDASDVDVLVEFEEGHPTGLFEFIGVMNFLEDILGHKVDLVMPEGLRTEFREEVFREAIRAA
jgi:predicted nucleotidyltransferase